MFSVDKTLPFLPLSEPEQKCCFTRGDWLRAIRGGGGLCHRRTIQLSGKLSGCLNRAHDLVEGRSPGC